MSEARDREIELYIDGASKGNPGPSGIGIVICEAGSTIKNISNYIGYGTNNRAEYTALIHGLQEGLMLRARRISVNTDSQLLCRQIKRIYKIKNPNILKLYNQALSLISSFQEFSIKHIPREQNAGADRLASMAVKEALKKGQAGGGCSE